MIIKYTVAILSILILVETGYLLSLHKQLTEKRETINRYSQDTRLNTAESLQKNEAVTTPSVNFEESVQKSDEYLSEKNYQKAIEVLESVLSNTSNQRSKMFIENKINFIKVKSRDPRYKEERKRRYDVKIDYKVKNRKDKVQVAKYYKLKGDACEEKKLYTLAVSYYDKALKLQPQNAEYYFAYGVAQMKIWPPKAQQYFNKAIALDSSLQRKLDKIKK